MLYFIVFWIVVLVASSIVGTALLHGFAADGLHRTGDRWIASVWLGTIVLAITLTTVAFGLPLSPLIGGLTIVALCSIALASRSVRLELKALRSQLSGPKITIFLGLAVVVSAYMTQRVTWIDTGLYHYGAINWLANFGAVPGLALLSKQFGFVSTWFALSAPFNPEILMGRACAMMNGFVVLLAILHCLLSMSHILQRRSQLSDWFICVFYALVLPILSFTHLLSVILVSASPDIPIALLVGTVAWAMLNVFNQRQDWYLEKQSRRLGTSVIPLVLAAGAVSIKLTALPLLGVTWLSYGLAKGWSFRLSVYRWAIASLITLVLLLPVLMLGITASGCPLYPSHFLCLDLPWSLSVQEAQDMANLTQGGEAWFGKPPSSVPAPVWLFWQWFQGMNSSKLIAALILAIPLMLPYLLKTAKTDRKPELIWLMLLAVIGIIFIIFNAPLMRFGIGYLFLLPSLAIAILLQTESYSHSSAPWRLDPLSYSKMLNLWPKSIFKPFISTVLIAAVVWVLLHSHQEQLFLPPSLPEVKLLQRQINNVNYVEPQDKLGMCWSAELPCASEPSQDIRLRRPAIGIQAGFSRPAVSKY